jgi:ribonuclease HI
MKQLSFLENIEPKSQTTKKKARNHWKLFVDGASRKNPGPSGAGIHLIKNDKSYKKCGYYLGIKTNNQAEYAALLLGILLLKKYAQSTDHIDIISDSELLVKQFKGEYKVKHPELKPLHLIAKDLLKDTPHSMMHVLREFNTVADQMANEGIDAKKKLPPEFLNLLKQHELAQ